MMDESFKESQYTFWSEEEQKYQKLFLKKAFDKDATDKDLYTYAMWYCQEQRAKYR